MIIIYKGPIYIYYRVVLLFSLIVLTDVQFMAATYVTEVRVNKLNPPVGHMAPNVGRHLPTRQNSLSVISRPHYPHLLNMGV